MAAESNLWLWLLGGGVVLSVALAARSAVAETEEYSDAGEDYVAAGAPLQPPLSPMRVTSNFGYRIDPISGQPGSWHPGLDLDADIMQPVRASESGLVTRAQEWYGYGNQVVIDHGDIGGQQLATSYSHMQQLYVNKGDYVEGGDTIGGAGSTGRSTGVHVHYEVTADGKAVDPTGYLGL